MTASFDTHRLPTPTPAGAVPDASDPRPLRVPPAAARRDAIEIQPLQQQPTVPPLQATANAQPSPDGKDKNMLLRGGNGRERSSPGLRRSTSLAARQAHDALRASPAPIVQIASAASMPLDPPPRSPPMPPPVHPPMTAPAQQLDVRPPLTPEPRVRPVVDRHRAAAV
jgi:hypothetical protein